MVGGGAVFDDTGQDERLNCMLPDDPRLLVSPQARGADLEVQPLPNPIDDDADRRLPVPRQEVPGVDRPRRVHDRQRRRDRRRSTSRTRRRVEVPRLEGRLPDAVQPGRRADLDAVRPGHEERTACKGLVYTGEPENLRQAAQGARRTSTTSSTGSSSAPTTSTTSSSRSAARRSRTSTSLAAVVPPFLADENPATQQYLDLFDEVPARRQVQGPARLQLLLGVAPVRQRREGVRRRPHPHVRLRERRRRSRSGPAAACTPPPTRARARARVAASSSRPRPTASRCPTTSSSPTGSSAAPTTTSCKLEGDYGTGAKLEDVGQDHRRPRVDLT